MADSFVHKVVSDWRSASLTPSDMALCEFAVKLSTSQDEINRDDLVALRATGLSDRAIHDAVQVIALFNYYSRIADGLGVEPEAFINKWGKN
jgi:uncharacterized peroxidase-related enzyme